MFWRNDRLMEKGQACRPYHRRHFLRAHWIAKWRGGFNLIELLVVITIIGILISLLLPAVQAAREAARRLQCSNNVKQIAMALHSYHTAHGTLPYGSGSWCAPEGNGGTWPIMILPQLEQMGLYNQINFNMHMKDQSAQVVTTVVPVYVCPSDSSASNAVLDGRFARDNPSPAAGLWYTGSMGPTAADGPSESNQCPLCPAGQTPSPSNYCCQGHNFGTLGGYGYPDGNTVGMFGRHHKSITFDMVRDGLSNTILFGETLPRQCSFISLFAVNFNVSPTNIPINAPYSDEDSIGSKWWLTCGFKSMHPGGANFAMADGSVCFFPTSIDYRLYNNLGTRAGNEVVSPP